MVVSTLEDLLKLLDQFGVVHFVACCCLLFLVADVLRITIRAQVIRFNLKLLVLLHLLISIVSEFEALLGTSSPFGSSTGLQH